MKKVTLLVFCLALTMICGTAQAQTTPKVHFLKITHVVSGKNTTDEYLLKGGEITVKDNDVKVTFAADATKNRTYEFDNIKTIVVELRNDPSANEVIEANAFTAWFDDAGQLHIASPKPLGTVGVYTIAGALVVSIESAASEAVVNLPSIPRGVYLVKAGDNTVKILK